MFQNRNQGVQNWMQCPVTVFWVVILCSYADVVINKMDVI